MLRFFNQHMQKGAEDDAKVYVAAPRDHSLEAYLHEVFKVIMPRPRLA